MRQVRLPAPLASFNCATDGPAYEESAEDEEDDHGFMSSRSERVGNGEKQTVDADLVVVEEEQITPVVHQNQDRGQPSYQVKRNGRPCVRKAGR